MSSPSPKNGMLRSGDSPETAEVVLERYRAMPPAEKLARVVDLNQVVDDLAASRLRRTYGKDLAPRELELRLAALRLDREIMVAVFRWDPDVEGY